MISRVKLHKLVVIIYILITLYFINTFVSSYFYLSYIPTYVSVIFYSTLTLACIVILRRSKGVLFFLGILFFLGLVVFISSSAIAESLSNYNKAKVESKPNANSFVFYGIYPSKAQFNKERNETEIRGLHGIVYIYNIDQGKWQSVD